MLQLSSGALRQVTQAFKAGDYPSAYQITYNDLKANYPTATGADADAIEWVGIAQQVNSGARTSAAIAIRASNKAADQLLNGRSIDLFGPEEQNSSNKIAVGFLRSVVRNNGALPAFRDIVNIDAQKGLKALKLPPEAWAGAVPSSLSQALTGFTTNSYYGRLTAAQRQTADEIHVMAGDLLAEYYAAPLPSSNISLDADLTRTAKNDAWVLNNLPGTGRAASGLMDAANTASGLWNRLERSAPSNSAPASPPAAAGGGDIKTPAPSSRRRDTDGYGLYSLDGAHDFDASSVSGWRKALRGGDQPDAAGFFPLSGAGIRNLDVEVAPNGASPLNPPATLHVYGPAPDTGMPTVTSFPLRPAGTTRLQLRAGDTAGRINDTGLHFAVTPEPGTRSEGLGYSVEIADSSLAPNQRAAARAEAEAAPRAPGAAITARHLYGPSGKPEARDIAQGDLGDCFFVSPLGSLAASQPDTIRNAIKYDARTKNFEVSFYRAGADLKPEARKVIITQADLAYDRTKGVNSLAATDLGKPVWPEVMESAYAKFREGHESRLPFAAKLDDLGRGGYAAKAIYALTGKPSQTVQAAALADQNFAHERMRTALQEGRPMMLNTNGMKTMPNDGLVKGDWDETLDRASTGHAYMLERVSKDAHGDVMVTVRNPWGTNRNESQGVYSDDPEVTVKLKDILANGHLQSIDIGPADPRRLQAAPELETELPAPGLPRR